MKALLLGIALAVVSVGVGHGHVRLQAPVAYLESWTGEDGVYFGSDRFRKNGK